ncbi:MAG TPA: efflux RND transporter permease subunit [Gemmatimonadaceae bacterium]|nr:efflux RND transporter permease subunit [Gemmatimonadaceae bacterium]
MAQSPSGLTGLSGVAIRRPVFTAMLMTGLVVLGWFSYQRLAIDQFPEIDLPIVTVQTTYPGASAEAVEREVTRRMEEAFNPVQGVRNINSISLEGVSQIIIEFELDRRVDDAAQDVRSKIEAIRQSLPEDMDTPIVQKLDPAAQPIVSLALSSTTLPMVPLTTLAEETLRRRLETVSGVGEVRVSGGAEREVRVFLLPARLQSLGVTVPEVTAALARQNLEVPAGRVRRGAGEQLVRVAGRITAPEQFGDVIVATRNGEPVRVRDVARVEDASPEERSLALLNDARALSIDILKVSGANTVAVADGVNAALDDMRSLLPPGTALRVVRDNSTFIRSSINDVIHELMLGALLTVLIVMLFLNDWKATAITSLALPVSVISSFLVMGIMGFTLNVLTLMALSLSIGILIDDAIVVIENIVRHREHGEDHFTAAANGTREIVLAVMATTLSIVAVFVPVAFMRGIIGRFFFAFGITVAWAVLVSLFVSFTLTPMLSAWWGVNPHGAHEAGNPVQRVIARFNRGFDRLAVRYRGVIAWALRRRRTTLLMAAGAFVAAIMLFPFIGGEFAPETDQSEFVVQFETPEGSSLAYTNEKVQQMGALLRAEVGVAYTFATVGAGATGTVTDGEIYVRLVPPDARERSQQELMAVARQRMATVFGVRTSVLVPAGIGGAVAPLQVEIRGPDIRELQRITADAMAILQETDEVVDLRSSIGDPRPEYRIDVNRDQANQIGVDLGAISATLRPLLAGEVATRWEDPSGEERDVVVQVAPEQRQSVGDLASIPVPTAATGPTGTRTVPLRNVAQISAGTAPAQIDRKNLQRIVSIGGSPSPDVSLAEASAVMRQRLAEVSVPPGYTVQLGGETQQLEETAGYVLESLVLAVILIFLILASQFESFTQPFAIMLSLPLSLVGVLLALLFTNSTLNIMSMIGVIMLMGLVTKNAILLIDNANERRRGGTERTQALIEAGAVRLRPIIMTTMAMIAGMLPVALALGEGGAFRAPMARAVIGGLITSTLLTLVVVPVAYTYLDGLGARVKRMFVSPAREREITAEREAAVGD